MKMLLNTISDSQTCRHSESSLFHFSHLPISFLSPASVQCHSRGSAHEAAAAWQQHGEQHGRLQPAEPVAEAGAGGPEPAGPGPKHRPDSTEPELQHGC